MIHGTQRQLWFLLPAFHRSVQLLVDNPVIMCSTIWPIGTHSLTGACRRRLWSWRSCYRSGNYSFPIWAERTSMLDDDFRLVTTLAIGSRERATNYEIGSSGTRSETRGEKKAARKAGSASRTESHKWLGASGSNWARGVWNG